MLFSTLSLCLVVASTTPAIAFDGDARGVVERVVDGDTVKMRIAIWLDQEITVSVRLAGIDAPELFRPKCAEEKRLARQASGFVRDFLSAGEASLIDIQRGKYAGRVVARIEANGADLATSLVSAGLAVRGDRGNWCDVPQTRGFGQTN